MLLLIFKGILLGLGAAVPVGPVNVEIARRTLRGGFVHGWLLGLGACTVDVISALLTGLSFSLTPLLAYRGVRPALGIAGGLFLAWLAIGSLRSAWREWSTTGTQIAPAPPGSHQHYLTGLLMNLLNPMILAFWFIGVPAFVGGITRNPRHDLPWICLGVAISTVSWVCSFAGAIRLSNLLLGKRRRLFLTLADLGGGLMLLGFAAAALWSIRMRP
jgi:L-lysine exporter family protein LysE/ArgO